MIEERTVPDEIKEMFDLHLGYNKAKDSAIRMAFFKFQLRNAAYLAKMAIQTHREAWAKIHAIYPDIKDLTNVHYVTDRQVIEIRKGVDA